MKRITITLEFDDETAAAPEIYKYLDELMANRELAYDVEVVEE